MGSQRDHRFLGWVRATDRRFGAGSVPATGRAGETPAGATVVKIVNFPDPMLDRFVADLRREGFSIIDLVAEADVEPFRQSARRACRQLGIRVGRGTATPWRGR